MTQLEMKMQDKNKKTPEQIRVEQEEKQRLIDRIIAATNSVPKSVMNGSQTKAASWKAAAVTARNLAESKSPGLDKLRNALGSLTIASS